MIRIFALLLLASFGALAASAPAPRAFATLRDALASIPDSYATDGRALLSVSGYRAAADWGPDRLGVATRGSALATNLGEVFNFDNGWGQLIFPGGGEVNLKHWGAFGNGTSNDLPYIRAAGSQLQLLGGGIFRAPPGVYMIRSPVRGDLVCYFSNLVNVSFHVDGATFASDDFADDEWTSASLVNVGTAATATTATPHGMAPGDSIVVKNDVDLGYNGMFIVSSTNGPNELSFTLSGYDTPPGMGSALIHLTDSTRTLFFFKNCRNVNLGRLRFSGTVLRRSVQYQLGWVVANFIEDCKTIRGEISATGAQGGWASGFYDLDRGRCEDFDVTFTGEDVGYPVRLNGSGHRSKFRVYANSIHRGAYIGGVEDSTFDIYVRDYDVTGVLLTVNPVASTMLQGNKNLSVLVDDTGTTEEIDLVAVGGTRYMATLQVYNVDSPVTNSNVRVTVRGKNMPDTSIMQSITYSTNHFIDGLYLSGNIDQSGLTAADVRHDFYFDQSASQGRYRGIQIENLIILPPTNSGAYNARLRIANLIDNPRVNNYRSGMPFNYAFPIGREIDVVPVFPGFEYGTAEQMQLQQLAGGLVLNYSSASHTLPYSVSSNEFTAQWVGKVPASGDIGLFAIGPHPDYATNSSFGLSVRSGSLIARIYGATKSDYRQLEVSGWQSAHGGLISEVSIVRTNGGVAIFSDGHRQAATETSTNSAPSWSGEVVGTYAVVGAEDESLGFSGAVYRMGIWDYDRQADFPSLATAWTSGQSAQGAVSDTIGLSVLNGGFETPGAGGADVFGSWTETAFPSSTVTQTNDAVEGSSAAAFNVDGSNAFAALTLNPPMTIGASYRVSLWAKTSSSSGGAIALVGPIDGESILQLTNGWQRFVLNKVWGGTTIQVKRADGANRSLLVDSIEVRRTGAVLDMDWTRAGADLLTGRRPTYSAETVTRVVPRTAGVSGDRGDASVTLFPGQDATVQRFASSLTTGRTVSFDSGSARIGDAFRILRTGAGAGTLTAAGRTVATDQWMDVAFDGSAWIPIGYGYVTNTYVTPPTNTLIAPLIIKVGTVSDPAIYILASNPIPSAAYHGKYGSDGIEVGVGTNARSAKLLVTDIPAAIWTLWSNIVLKGDIVRSNGTTLTGSLDSKAATNHTHDASNTVSGQFESARLGSGTSDTDTFLRGGEPPTWDQLSEDDIPNLPTSKITSGTFAAERLGTGTATTNTFLQGNGTNAPFWGTIPSVPSPTNGIADAPADGILYGRKNNSWTQADISDLSGVSSFGLAWVDGSVADSVDALDALDLTGAGVATIDSPAKYAVRVGSGGTVSTRHRLNLIAATGLTLAISDDAINDEADVTVGIADRDWGDITSTSSGSVWDIDAGAVGEAEIADGAVAYDKIQNVTASRLLGRAPGSDGPPVEIEIGDGLAFDGATLKVSSTSPALLGWATFAVDNTYSLVNVDKGGAVSAVTGNALSNTQAMEVTLEMAGGPYPTSYHVTADIQGTDDDTDATYLPKWWIKVGGKTDDAVTIKAAEWSQIGGASSCPVGFTYTFWIWARE